MERYSKYMQLVLAGFFLISNSSFGMDGAPSNPEFEKMVLRSKKYHSPASVNFPTRDTNSIEAIGKDSPEKQEKIVGHAKSATVLVHSKVETAYQHFLDHKRTTGTPAEKDLYKKMTVRHLVNRFIKYRPVVFYKPDCQPYQTVFRDGYVVPQKDVTTIANHKNNAEVLKSYISNDEIELAAFTGLFSGTFFINSGDRDNCGEINFKNEPYQREGFFAGLVGACFEAKKWLEYKYMVVTQEQNTIDHGYGLNACDEGMFAIHSKLYDGLKFLTYDEAVQDKSGRFIELDGKNKGSLFDKTIYAKCIELRVLPFLNEAHQHAKNENKKAYVHIVGLGLGVWQIDERQVEWMIDVYKKIISENDLSSISDIHFSWFEVKDKRYNDSLDRAKQEIQELGKEKKITIHFSRRNPAAELVGDDKDKILFAMYAWDANAAPGNEYRLGGRCLKSSGDASAACSSTIAEMHNPWINQYLDLEENKDHNIKDPIASTHGVIVTSDSEKDISKQKTKHITPNVNKPMLVANADSENMIPKGDATGAMKNANPAKDQTIQAWYKNKWLIRGGIGVTFAAVLYYLFNDRIAHWSAMPHFGFRK